MCRGCGCPFGISCNVVTKVCFLQGDIGPPGGRGAPGLPGLPVSHLKKVFCKTEMPVIPDNENNQH